MSSPSEPVEMASISSTGLAPSRMMEPLPKTLSIWLSAASSALFLSIELLSTTLRLVCPIAHSSYFTLASAVQIASRNHWKHRMYLFCSHCKPFRNSLKWSDFLKLFQNRKGTEGESVASSAEIFRPESKSNLEKGNEAGNIQTGYASLAVFGERG